MKKIISILLLIFILIASLHLTVSTHFCSGKFSTAKIGLEGKKVSCGMETNLSSQTTKSQSEILYSHCCDNISKNLSVDNFQISSPLDIHKISLNLLQVILTPVLQLLDSPLSTYSITKKVFHNSLLSLSKRLTLICVFRK